MKKSPFAPGMAVFLCACLGLGATGQAQTPTADHRAQAMALIDLMRRHGLETDNVPGTIRDEGKQGYRFTSPSVDLHDARYWEKKVTLKKVEATVYASEEHLKDLLKTMRGNGGLPLRCPSPAGRLRVENKAHFVPGQYEAILAAGNVEVRIWFNNTLPDNNAFTPEKDEWYKQADAKHPAALRSLITAIASDVCRLGLDKPSSQASGDRPTTGTPASRPSEPLPGGKDPCAVDREAMMAASLRARLSFANLSALRSAITQLDSEWSSRRQVAFWSGTIDIAFIGGSALTKGITQSVTGRFVSQSLQSAVIESSLKGILQQGLKQYNEYCARNSIDPAAALEAMAAKGAKSAANKAAEDFITTVLERVVLDEIQAGRFGGLNTARSCLDHSGFEHQGLPGPNDPDDGLRAQRVRLAGGEVHGTARFDEVRHRRRVDVAWQARELAALDKGLRDREIEAGRRWEQAMGELDRMRSSFNYCQQLHPESPRDDSPQPPQISNLMRRRPRP